MDKKKWVLHDPRMFHWHHNKTLRIGIVNVSF